MRHVKHVKHTYFIFNDKGMFIGQVRKQNPPSLKDGQEIATLPYETARKGIRNER